MRKIFTGILCLSLAAALTGCNSGATDSGYDTDGVYQSAANTSEETGETTSVTFMTYPPDEAASEPTGAADGMPSEAPITTIFVPEDSSSAAQDVTLISAGKIPEQTVTTEIETTVVYTSEPSRTEDDPLEGLNPWNTAAKSPKEAEKAANNEETSEFFARIISVSEDYICAEVLSEKWSDILGPFVQIGTKQLETVPECSAGDYAKVIMDEEIGIVDTTYPSSVSEGISEIVVTQRTGIELTENSRLAKVVSCNEAYSREHYAIVVQTFNLMGYGFETKISMKSNEKFSFGDWVKITFAEDTIFMESYPLQVPEECVLGIEKV